MATHVYSLSKQRFLASTREETVHLDRDIIWLDLLNPSSEEESFYEMQLGIDLPLREELKSIEPSSRLYKENGTLYMTMNVVSKADTMQPESSAMACLLKDHLLITIRYTEPRGLTIFADHVLRHPQDYPDGKSLLCGMIEAVVERSAEVLERIGYETDQISRTIFADPISGTGTKRANPADGYSQTLKQIAFYQNLMAKVRESMVSIGRVVRFPGLAEAVTGNRPLEDQLKSIDRDIASLGDQASFISANITFLLNASLGLIGNEQNAIIKFFSMVAVIFLPPTLIASIYGMNFDFMPELHHHWGYPVALGLMFVSAVGPYCWFKFKRWL